MHKALHCTFTFTFPRKEIALMSLVTFREELCVSWAFCHLIKDHPLGTGDQISGHPPAERGPEGSLSSGGSEQFKSEVKAECD